MIKVDIDEHSGFCFGVDFAINMAEDYLETHKTLYSLGDIVHNETEVERLKNKGLKPITLETFNTLKNETVLIRAHGEPPATYKEAMNKGITLIDASCPVVLKLQRRVQDFFSKGYQIIIYGKANHAEVIGLNGQCNNTAIVVSDIESVNSSPIDFSKKTVLISQTTKSSIGLKEISEYLKNLFIAKGQEGKFEPEFIPKDTLCRQVSNRDKIIMEFAEAHDVVVFISGEKSSNGKALFQACKSRNEKSYLVQSEADIKREWFYLPNGELCVKSVGVSGATSTPMWLIKKVADAITVM